jgi:hypothetical protein
MHVEICGGQSSIGPVIFLRLLRVIPANIIPSLPHTHLHLHKNKRSSLGKLPEVGRHWMQKYLAILLMANRAALSWCSYIRFRRKLVFVSRILKNSKHNRCLVLFCAFYLSDDSLYVLLTVHRRISV